MRKANIQGIKLRRKASISATRPTAFIVELPHPCMLSPSISRTEDLHIAPRSDIRLSADSRTYGSGRGEKSSRGGMVWGRGRGSDEQLSWDRLIDRPKL